MSGSGSSYRELETEIVLPASHSLNDLPAEQIKYPWFVKPDIDAFVALFNNNLATLLVVIAALTSTLGPDIVYGRIVPGVGLSMVFGNIWYAWMARRLAFKEGRIDVCAQPYGINTPGAFAFVFSIINPVFFGATGTVDERRELAWKVGVAANFIAGVILIVGALVGDVVRKVTPPVALLTSLAGIGFSFLCLNEFIEIAAVPYIAYLPVAIVFVGYFGKVKMGPVPTALLALLVGTALGWATGHNHAEDVREAGKFVKFYTPAFPIKEIFTNMNEIGPYISIVVPVAITVAVGTIQCVESASQAGDNYGIRESMLVDGLGTIVGALFGSILGMTVFIGHPAFKAMGARSGYSLANAAGFLIICMTGLAAPLLAVIVLESVSPIIVFVGLIIGADTLSITPKRHFPAVIFGLAPLVAQWADSNVAQSVGNTFFAYYSNLFAHIADQGMQLGQWVNGTFVPVNTSSSILTPVAFGAAPWVGINYEGLHNLGSGGLLESIFLAAIVIFIIDRRFVAACCWSLGAAFIALIGLINADKVGFLVKPDDDGWKYCVGFTSIAAFFLLLHFAQVKDWIAPPFDENAPEWDEQQENAEEQNVY